MMICLKIVRPLETLGDSPQYSRRGEKRNMSAIASETLGGAYLHTSQTVRSKVIAKLRLTLPPGRESPML
jgi:hypothetical protein